jgi:hypothetical protein
MSLVEVRHLKTYMDISLTQRQEDAVLDILDGLQSELEAFLGRPVTQDEVTEEHVIPSYFQGVPATSFFYDHSLDSTETGLNYIQPSQVIYARNTPISNVKRVSIRNLSADPVNLAEAIQRKATITAASVSGASIVFTATNDFTVGQRVTVSDINPSSLQVSGREITAVTTTTFTVGDAAGASGSYVSGGLATATGNDYTVHRYGVELYRGFPNDVVSITYTGGLDGSAIKMFKLMILRAAAREVQNMHDDVVGLKDLNTRNVAPLETGFLEKELAAMKSYKRRRIA